MSAWLVRDDSRHIWATWSVYENGEHQGSFFNEAEAGTWIERVLFFRDQAKRAANEIVQAQVGYEKSGHEKSGHETNTNGYSEEN